MHALLSSLVSLLFCCRTFSLHASAVRFKMPSFLVQSPPSTLILVLVGFGRCLQWLLRRPAEAQQAISRAGAGAVCAAAAVAAASAAAGNQVDPCSQCLSVQLICWRMTADSLTLFHRCHTTLDRDGVFILLLACRRPQVPCS